VNAAIARAWFGVTAIVTAVGVVLSVSTTFDESGTWAAVAVFAFFTVQSNLIVGGTSLLLARDPSRSSTTFWVLRLTGIIAITITAVVYHAILADDRELHGLAHVADVLLHTVVPALAVGGWLLFGPRGRAPARLIVPALIFPVAWLVFTLIRGEAVGVYPYPFLDVSDLGYARATLNCVVVAVLYVGVAALAVFVDGRVARRVLEGVPAARAD
jgi:hypothetical protein